MGPNVDLLPFGQASPVTPDDNADLPNGATKALYVGGAGNLAVRLRAGVEVTFNGVQAGTVLHISAVRVKATGTTATNIIALY